MSPSTVGTALAANRGPLGGWFSTLNAHRELVYVLAQREIKIRYKQSIMGFLWAILMPLLIVGAGVIVKAAMATLSGSEFEASDLALVTVKAVPWAFFVASIRMSSSSLITNSNLVTKIYMPREVFPFASVLAQLVDFVVAAAAVSIILPFLGVRYSFELIWIPFLLAALVLIAAAAGLFLSAASLFFRDVKYLVEVFVTFAIFFTPVFYEASMFGKWEPLLLLNPVAPILEGIGAIIVGGALPGMGWLAYSACAGVLGFVAAILAFKRMEPYFAESV